MPDTNRVLKELEQVQNLIYFGLYENETSRMARIVIPAKNFFEKEDVRLSYGHHYVSRMHQVVESRIGISEYDFTKRLFETFGFEGLQAEDAYLDHWMKQCNEAEGCECSPAYEALPYASGFGEDGEEEFEFIDEYDDDFINPKRFTKYRKQSTKKKPDERFWLLSPKSSKSLNTQFVRDTRVQMHPDSGYEEGEAVRLTSEHGTHTFTVHLNEDIKPNCVVITNNTVGVNFLTPAILSEEGHNACYQEVKVSVEPL
jgi:anaerobic selenocysteine-containing dehydrogenase